VENLTPHYYVAIGASAGGLEAIEAFFRGLPESNANLSFIIIQHLSPDYKSLMVEILSKQTKMRVVRAENDMIVEANCVYLIPPRKNLRILLGRLVLTDQDHLRSINLPIDIFFRSLAEDQSEKAIGIILSGSGSDGTRGVRAIKENGGMIIAQEEKSARFDSMPRSAIETGLADFILKPEEMGNQLLRYSERSRVEVESQSHHNLMKKGFERIFSLIQQRYKIDFTDY
jgi:two-component system, chemotaxis family, CheB/CheR fusion protein